MSEPVADRIYGVCNGAAGPLILGGMHLPIFTRTSFWPVLVLVGGFCLTAAGWLILTNANGVRVRAQERARRQAAPTWVRRFTGSLASPTTGLLNVVLGVLLVADGLYHAI